MNLRRLVVASKNPDKIREVEAVLERLTGGVDIVRGLDWPEVEETEATLEGNALLKARAVWRATGVAAVADDTGLEVDALGGAPGVFTARYSGPDATYASNVAKLLADLEGVEERSAGGAEHDRETEQPEEARRDEEVREVLGGDVDAVLAPDEPALERRETRLHEHHERRAQE